MRKKESRKTAIWLLLCFPYGLARMWRASCQWNILVKSLVTAAIAALICVIALWPTPEQNYGTRVTLVGKEKDIAIFGPELPTGYDYSLYPPNPTDNNLFAEEVVDDTVYVYVNSGAGSTYYHTLECEFAYASDRLSLYEAYMMGYTTPCGKCLPPVYE